MTGKLKRNNNIILDSKILTQAHVPGVNDKLAVHDLKFNHDKEEK